MANTMVVSDLIEGEFTVEEDSGFSCRECWTPLLVGAASCPKCGKHFPISTPNKSNIPPGYSSARAKVLSVIYRDRISTSETERVNGVIHPPITNPKYIERK